MRECQELHQLRSHNNDGRAVVSYDYCFFDLFFNLTYFSFYNLFHYSLQFALTSRSKLRTMDSRAASLDLFAFLPRPSTSPPERRLAVKDQRPGTGSRCASTSESSIFLRQQRWSRRSQRSRSSLVLMQRSLLLMPESKSSKHQCRKTGSLEFLKLHLLFISYSLLTN